MQKYLMCFILILFTVYLFSCVETKVFVQQVEIEGPMIQPMTKVTDNKKPEAVETSFRVLINSKKNIDINTNGHTYVNLNGEYEIEEVPGEIYYLEYIGDNIYQFKGNNTKWNLPEIQLGLNLDIPASKSFVFSGGIDYSNINSISYWNGNLGMAYINEFKNSALRIDGILNLTYLNTNVQFVETHEHSGDDFKYVYFYNKEVSDNYTDFKFMITFNTRNSKFPVEFFANVVLGTQRFFKSNINSIDADEIILDNKPVNFSFGIFKNITPETKIIIGTTINNQTQRNPALTYPVYFLQFDSYLFSND